MLTQSREELYRSFRDAIDLYFQLQRDYEILEKQRDALLEENTDLKKLLGVYQ